MALDTQGLKPLDTTGLSPASEAGGGALDTSNLKPLDTSGLRPAEEEDRRGEPSMMAGPGIAGIPGREPQGEPPEADEELGRLGSAGSSFMRGAGQTAAGIPKGIALVSAPGPEVWDNLDRIDAGNPPIHRTVSPGGTAGIAGITADVDTELYRQYAEASPEERREIRNALNERARASTSESELYQLGNDIDAWFRENFPTNPEFRDEFWSAKVPHALGSATTFVISSAVSRGTLRPLGRRIQQVGTYAAPAATGAGINSAELFEDALANGAEISTALEAAGWGRLFGLSEAVPIGNLFNRMDRVGGGQIRRYLSRAMRQGTEEAVQEAFVGIMNDATAQGLYDPERGVWTMDRAEEGAVGFTTGAILETLMTLALPGRRRGAEIPTDERGVPEGAVPGVRGGGRTGAEAGGERQEGPEQHTAEEVDTFARERVQQIEAAEAPSEAERQERDFLRQNIDNPQVIASAYGVEIVPTGERERARAETPPPTPEDQASPLPTETIQAGRENIQDALGQQSASQILEQAGFPPINSTVNLTTDGGAQLAGTVIDAFDEGGVRGAKVQLDDGTVISEPFETLQGRVTPTGEAQDAEAVRGDTGPVEGARPERPRGEVAGRPDLQRPAEARPEAGERQAPREEEAPGRPVEPESVETTPTSETPTEAARAPISRRDVEGDQGRDTAVTATGRRVPVRYAVVEAGELVASQRDDGRANPGYPAELQPRDRSRAVSDTQISDILNPERFDPRILDRSPQASTGAPIVAEDGIVESGNGRILALRKAYREGREVGDTYRNYLAEQGYPVEGMNQPVLVRVREGEMEAADRAAFTREANERDTLGMSATERAMADAAAMSDGMLDLYEGGDMDAAANRPFVRSFLDQIVGRNEQAGMIAADGSMSQEAVRRIEAALLAKAYGDADLVASLVESPDSNIKAIGGALMDVAASWAQMRSDAQSGQIDSAMDQTERLLEAVRLIQRARREKRNVAEMVGQRDLMSGDALHPDAEAFLRLMFRNTRNWTQPAGREKLSEALKFYIDAAGRAQPGVDLLGQAAPEPSRILETAKERQYGAEAAAEQQQDLLAQPEGSPGERVRPSSEGRAERPEPDAAQEGEPTPARAREEGAGAEGQIGEARSQPVSLEEARREIEAAGGTVTSTGTRQASRPGENEAVETEFFRVEMKQADGTPVVMNNISFPTMRRDLDRWLEIPSRTGSPAGLEALASARPRGQPQAQTEQERRDQAQHDIYARRIEEIEDPAELRAYAEELRTALMTDERTGLGSNRAWLNRTPKAHIASIDLDSLKWVNDNMGHDAGDRMIEVVGDAFREAGIADDAFHVSGDEFYAHSEDEQRLRDAMDRAREYLRGITVEGNGLQFTGPGFSYGIGTNIERAEEALHGEKTAREEAGERAARGERPRGVAEAAQAAEQEPTPRDREEAPEARPRERAERPEPDVAPETGRALRPQTPQELVDDSDLLEATRANIAGETPERAALIVLRDMLEAGTDVMNDAQLPSDINRPAGQLVRRIEQALESGQDLGPVQEEAVQMVREWLGRGDIDVDLAGTLEATGNLIESQMALPSPAQTSPEQTDRIEDFGERIEGARKFEARKLSESLEENADLAGEPLSKTFPQPNYEKLAEEGMPKESLALVALARAQIPRKPRQRFKLKRWVQQAEFLRDFARRVLDGESSADDRLSQIPGQYGDETLQPLFDTAELIAELPADQLSKAAEYRVMARPGGGFMLHGPKRRIYRLGDMGQVVVEDYATFRERALRQIREDLESSSQKKRDRYTPIEVRQMRATGEGVLTWRPRGRIEVLKGGFADTRAAREYLEDNRDALQATIDRLRKGPEMRGERNVPRQGPERRQGDVTPEGFAETFGFRGVQFGNYVEGPRRQQDLNEAYDALIDLAETLDIPPLALSLNGELGLAFGARGKGGRAKAHFEPHHVVINLTKTAGPGSLAHEWLHAVDNYFARQAGGKEGAFITDPKLRPGDLSGVREEMAQAWQAVHDALATGSFADRAASFDSARSKPYWNTPIEKAARAFEKYIRDRMGESNIANDYLANINEKDGAYPTDEEMRGGIRQAFDRLFETLETRETDRGVEMFSIRDEGGDNVVPFRGRRRPALTGADVEGRPAAPEPVTMTDELSSIIQEGRRAYAHWQRLDRQWQTAIGNADSPSRFMNEPANDAMRQRVEAASDAVTESRDRLIEAVEPGYFDAPGLANEYTPGAIELFGEEARPLEALTKVRDVASERVPQDDQFSLRLRDDFTRDAEQVTTDLQARLQELGIADRVALRLRERIQAVAEGKASEADGRYLRGVIEVALTAPDATRTLNHEVIHALRDLGLIRGAEWRTLERAARADTERMDTIRQRYERLGLSEEAMVEEAVADMYADWTAARSETGGFMRRAFERIRDFLRALGNVLIGRGYRTADSVFRSVERGEVGRRRPQMPESDPIVPEPQFALRPGDFDSARAAAITREGVFTDGFSEVPETVIDFVRQKLQDKFIDLKRVQESTGTAPDQMDAYLAEELYHGKAEAAIEEARDTSMKPLLDAIREADLTVEEAGEYLYARHAKERNKRIQEINPMFAEEGGGSGMTDAEAETILRKYEGDPKVERIGKLVDEITAKHRDLLASSGLETPEAIEAWEQTYEHYVPLKGREGDADGRASPSRGRGFDVRGRTKAATGRRSMARDIVANLLAQYETDIIRSQKAEVGRALLRFVEAHPDETLWEVDRIEYAGRVNPQTGLVEYRPDQSYQLADNVLAVKVDGVDHHITFHGTRGKRIAAAMKNLGAANAGTAVRAFAAVNRVLSAVNTSLNPEFVISNLARDLQTAGINLAGTEADSMKGRILKDVPSAWRGIRRSQKGKDSEWARYFEEFRRAGGKTGWIDAHNDVDRLNSKLEKEIKAYQRSPGDPRRLIRLIGDFVEAENIAVENAVRLSSFVHGRRVGMSDARAASLAKNLTVNFNRKGEYGVLMNSLYLFYNASVQGSIRMFQALRSPKVRKIAGGIVVFAAMLDIANRLLGGDDDDGEPLYDKIPPWVKERNLIIMSPIAEKGYFKIPLPWGYNVFHVLGQQTGEAASAAMGFKREYSPLDSALTILSAVAGSFNPLGSEATLGQFLSPTVTDPIISIESNRDWAGRPIRPGENPFEKAPSPDSQKYWSSTGEVPRWVAQTLNDLTGGSEVRPGTIDISPTTLEYLYEFATGGAGRFISNTVDAPIKKMVEGEVDAYRIPFARKVYGEVGSRATQDRFYENLEQVYYAENELKAARESRDSRAEREVRREQRVYLDARIRAKVVEKRLRALREKRNAIRARQMPERMRRSRLRDIEERMEREMIEFNRYLQERRR